MVSSRKRRANAEATFLEMVKGQLDVIVRELSNLQSKVDSIVCNGVDMCLTGENDVNTTQSDGLSLEPLLPPPAPPCLDIYDRTYLLNFRSCIDSTKVRSFKVMDSAQLQNAFHMDSSTEVLASPIAAESCTTMDWDSLKFELDALDAPTLPARVWYDPDEITAFVAEVSNTTEETSDDKQLVETRKQAALLRSIWNAQHNAKRRRWNEDRSQAINKPVQVTQGFWRTWKSKLANRITEANKVEVNMDKAKLATNFPVHVGSCGTAMDSRVRGAVHKTPILSEEPRSGSSHSYELEQPSRADIEVREFVQMLWKRYEEHQFLPAIPTGQVVDQETKKAIAKRKLEMPIYRTSNPTLYETQSTKTPNAGSLKGIRLVAHEYRPYICEDCASYSDSNDFCNFCGGCKLTESVCVCSHSGSCGIGSCHASDDASHASELEDFDL
mmetsp:Transcript_24372/g.38680  ORF Transcript_24372/g.38680 Transcript_24372/m.38680 type:complete len:441 (-) Transcript_24372:70-1392(-)